MAESTVNTTASSVPLAGAVSPHRIFWATWFGWMLDGFDSSMYSYVLVGALTELLPASRHRGEQGQYRALWRRAVFDLHAGLGLLDGVGLGRGPLWPGPDHVLDGAGLLGVHRAVRAVDRAS